ncbi:hypothetical protein [Oceanirhabdus sp. W0125-5]|uniref:hypothetical protein n=1 Tax=Oceanirhabdus sp. W0125-5 TaxID=2999116 RepID=UPI0022F2C14C|nr:hypothetical protein [Oceanirhabdus sp. W0125-5]WBW95929.1 hypothetical protein OW730_19885 [Oceanirhabdus sp. W0125-5]
MILREFDLDIPNIGDKNKRVKFRDEIRCIASMYERYFSKFKTKNCWKILIECVDMVTNEKVRDLLGAYTIQVKFNIDEYFKLSNTQKKKIVLECLKEGIDKVCDEMKWEKSPFEEAYNKIIENNYENNWTWKKPVRNPTKEYKAEVFCEHHVDVFNISIIIKNYKGEELIRKMVKDERPNEFSYVWHFGELKWISDNEVVLINQDGNERWSVKI